MSVILEKARAIPLPVLIAGLFALVVIRLYIYPFFIKHASLRDIPGPAIAKLSDLWLFRTQRRGQRSLAVDALHREHGTFVRIQPNHISIASDAAIKPIYGHSAGLLKSEFYDSFATAARNVFNVRDKAEHTRKRKMMSHGFSLRTVQEFEPYMHDILEKFVGQWDRLVDESRKFGQDAQFDCLDWFNYVAFDMIGDLAFGKPFGMVEAGRDIATLQETSSSAPTYAPAVQIINRRGEIVSTCAIIPKLLGWARYIPDPFFSKGTEARENLTRIGVASVRDRLTNPPKDARVDILARLQEAKDDKGKPLGPDELTAEALAQIVGGSDTTSNSSCAVLYYLVKNPRTLRKLQEELDDAIPVGTDVPTYGMIKNLPYLENVINETHRIHSTLGQGLPRIVGKNGLTICGRFFPPGTVVSVPSYTIHHDKEIWGEDALEFRPERFETLTPRQKDAFIPFSIGPRACIGRNVAEMEMKLILATWANRYQPQLLEELVCHEGFFRKPNSLHIALRRRD